MGIVEIKLASEGIYQILVKENTTSGWEIEKNKQGGGVMLLIRKDLLVESVTYGVEEAEVLKINLRQNTVRYSNIVVTYVLPYSNSWREDE